jgi:hypothetical protein
MFFNSSVSRTIGRIVLASTLCVLAVAFAMEAKMAWYGPAAGLKSGITDAKAMPADMPKLVAHRLIAPAPVAPQTYFFIPFFLIAATFFLARFSRRLAIAPGPSGDVRHSFFSPFVFFRPPPTYIR